METKDATVIPYHKSNRGRSANVPKQVTPNKRTKAAGRKAFQTDECEIHGKASDGAPCAKFSHLRTDGLGHFKPPFFRRVIVQCTKLLRPLFIAGLAFVLYFLITHVIFKSLHIGNSLPGSTNGRVSDNVRHSSGNSVSHSVPKSHSAAAWSITHHAVSE